MTMPFRNLDKHPGAYPVNSVVSLFSSVADAEAALSDLDANGFGDDTVYGRGEEIMALIETKGQGPLARIYRAMQSVTGEAEVIQRYEKKVAEGDSFIMVHLLNPEDRHRVGELLKAHRSNELHFLGRSSFQKL